MTTLIEGIFDAREGYMAWTGGPLMAICDRKLTRGSKQRITPEVVVGKNSEESINAIEVGTHTSSICEGRAPRTILAVGSRLRPAVDLLNRNSALQAWSTTVSL